MDSSSPNCVFHEVNVHDAPFQVSNAAGVKMVLNGSTEMETFLRDASGMVSVLNGTAVMVTFPNGTDEVWNFQKKTAEKEKVLSAPAWVMPASSWGFLWG